MADRSGAAGTSLTVVGVEEEEEERRYREERSIIPALAQRASIRPKRAKVVAKAAAWEAWEDTSVGMKIVLVGSRVFAGFLFIFWLDLLDLGRVCCDDSIGF